MSEQRGGGGTAGACAAQLASFIRSAGAMSTEESGRRHAAGDQHTHTCVTEKPCSAEDLRSYPATH